MNIGFIGAGNMATAMVGGLKGCGYSLYAYDINPDSLKKLEGLGVRTLSDKADLTEVCDVIVLAVKPNVYEAVLTDLKGKTKQIGRAHV